MPASREMNALGESCLRYIVLLIIVQIVLCILFGALFVFMLVLTGTGMVSEKVATVISLTLVMTVGTSSLIAFGIIVYQRQSRRLNAAFAPYGIKYTGWRSYYTGCYQGMVGERMLQVLFFQDRMMNIRLGIAVGAPLHTRMGLGTKAAFGNAAMPKDMRVLPLDPAFAHLKGWAHDERWATDLLNTPESREALLRLTHDTGNIIRNVVISPVGVNLALNYIRMHEITLQNAEAWINDLVAVAHAAERLEPPAERLEPSRLDQPGPSVSAKASTTWLIIFIVLVVAMAACLTIGISAMILAAPGAGT